MPPIHCVYTPGMTAVAALGTCGVPFTHFQISGPVQTFTTDDQPHFLPAKHWLQEWTEYWVEAPHATHLRLGATTVPPIHPGSSIFRVVYRNAVGHTSIQPFSGARPLGSSVPFEVLSAKTPNTTAHLAFLRALTQDVTRILASANYAPRGMTRFLSDRVSAPPTPLFLLQFFTEHHSALTAACARVTAHPHRTLTVDEQLDPLAFARDVTVEVLLDILQHPERLRPAPHLPVASALQGMLPETVLQRRAEHTVNTPENQFVLAFVQNLIHAADRVMQQEWWDSLPADRKEGVIHSRSVAGQCAHFLKHAGVTTLTALPTASRVLQRRDGYATLAQLREQFRHSQAPFLGRAQQAIDARDIADLYEVWAFLRLAQVIGDALACPGTLQVPTTASESVAWNARADFAGHGALVYNATPPSMSVPYRPDLVWYRGSTPVAAFDAKFRVRPGDAGTFQEEDISKMHAYRDALGLRSAVILYPGNVTRFYPSSPAPLHTPTLLDTLGVFEGVGARPLMPGAV